jgi:hypothetical protein
MRRIIWLLAFSVCALASGQTPRAVTGAVVQSWKYDQETKVLSLKIVNTSSKDVTSYNISITLKYADGSTDYTDSRPNEADLHGRHGGSTKRTSLQANHGDA